MIGALKLLLLTAACLMTPLSALGGSKCFMVAENNTIIQEQGDCKSRHSCCSTFKIAISLMGFNEGVLKSESDPEIPFEPGYPDLLEAWKHPQNPTTWMKNSCVWYSQLITLKMGVKKFSDYVAQFNYGNRDVSGDKDKDNGLTNCWLSSSLKISAAEQIEFLNRLIENKLPVSKKSLEMTRHLLFNEDLSNGWKLYGKTGSGYLLNDDGSRNARRPIGWFVGWLTNGDRTMILAHYVEEDDSRDPLPGKNARRIAIEKVLNLIQGR